MYFPREVAAETRLLFFVVRDGCHKLFLGIGMESASHPSWMPSLAKTSSAGTQTTLPLRIS